MFVKNTLSAQFRRNALQLAQFCTNLSADNLTFKPKFSKDEQQKILSILNESNVEQLAQFDVTKVRIKNLDSWKAKHGPFRSLTDILEVEGLGEKVLERLCNSIVNEKTDPGLSVDSLVTTVNNGKKRGQILTPPLGYEMANKLKNAVGIHLAPTGVSWAKLCVEKNDLETWNFHNFANLPNKLSPVDTFDLAYGLLSKIPPSDVYIMEAAKQLPGQSGKPVSTYTQLLELNSMLLALLNTSPSHSNIEDLGDAEKQLVYENKVYYLRANLPARLFSTLVGNERVAATGIITKLLERNSTLPCSAISVSESIRNIYNSQNSANREMLGQAVMLVVCFMDLCVYKNPVSQAAIQAVRRNQR